MSTAGGFHVDPAQIRAHADTVAGIADGLSAATSGLPGELAENALGTFVEFVSAGLSTTMSQAGESLSQAVSTVHEVSAALAQIAEDYETADDANGALLQKGCDPR
ncbi:ESX-1 secretion-associated protein [Saccharopolyspora sp. HNM0983]|uniref:ESX-1 secretion-associated protein n=1 Tax=Saccharopolyspora montiporae TaxID=2781240 RepID=A0A929B9Q6_9PSEU|nr:type VII secretion target [Saccharopolyspora sp. HNM0983]MBE9375887.1 ESX-1 secretion-associated protein [Saccharopolyspora sp. HNM0983]